MRNGGITVEQKVLLNTVAHSEHGRVIRCSNRDLLINKPSLYEIRVIHLKCIIHPS
jgi:hypothetical protein